MKFFPGAHTKLTWPSEPDSIHIQPLADGPLQTAAETHNCSDRCLAFPHAGEQPLPVHFENTLCNRDCIGAEPSGAITTDVPSSIAMPALGNFRESMLMRSCQPLFCAKNSVYNFSIASRPSVTRPVSST